MISTASVAEVVTAAFYAETMEFLTKMGMNYPPDVILCDIGMPGEDGYAVLRNVRAFEASRRLPESDQIPIIALTAYGQAQERVKALAAGFRRHLAKPFDPDELATVIAGLAGRLNTDSRPQKQDSRFPEK